MAYLEDYYFYYSHKGYTIWKCSIRHYVTISLNIIWVYVNMIRINISLCLKIDYILAKFMQFFPPFVSNSIWWLMTCAFGLNNYDFSWILTLVRKGIIKKHRISPWKCGLSQSWLKTWNNSLFSKLQFTWIIVFDSLIICHCFWTLFALYLTL